jgi:hypothetical protein
MNDLSSDIGLLKREFRDTRSVLSRLDHQTRKLFEPSARPAVARFAACQLIARTEKRHSFLHAYLGTTGTPPATPLNPARPPRTP